jgi:hypothetical protein
MRVAATDGDGNAFALRESSGDDSSRSKSGEFLPAAFITMRRGSVVYAGGPMCPCDDRGSV